jgi:hypothetical protein
MAEAVKVTPDEQRISGKLFQVFGLKLPQRS